MPRTTLAQLRDMDIRVAVDDFGTIINPMIVEGPRRSSDL